MTKPDPTPPAGPPAATETPDPPEVPEPGPEADDEQDGGQDDTPGATGAIAKARQQAAGYRTRAKAAEAAAQLAEDQVVDLLLERNGLARKLFDAVAPELPRTDDGRIDPAAFAETVRQIRADYGVASGVPQPNPQQGTPNPAKPARGLADAFAHPQRRR